MEEDVQIRSVKRTFDIIDVLAKSEIMGTSELAKNLDLPVSTVNDHLQTLNQLGYVTRHDDGYRASTRFMELGDRIKDQHDIYQTAAPELDSLASDTDEHATLMIEEHGYAVILYTAIGEKAVGLSPYSGTRVPLHRTAPGKAILAFKSQEFLENVLDRRGFENSAVGYGLPTSTDSMVTDREALFQQLEEVRERGYGIARGELINGICSVAVPIRTGEDRVLGAVGIHGPSSRIDEPDRIDELVGELDRTADIIKVNTRYR